MKLQQSVETCFRKFITLSGRASRSEYWWFALVYFIVGVVSQLIHPHLGTVVGLVFLLPLWTVGVRRLHDIGRSGWWVLLGFIPLLGALVLIYFAVQPSEPGSNDYGPEPEATDLIAPA